MAIEYKKAFSQLCLKPSKCELLQTSLPAALGSDQRLNVKCHNYDNAADMKQFYSQFYSVAEHIEWPEDIRLMLLQAAEKNKIRDLGKRGVAGLFEV